MPYDLPVRKSKYVLSPGQLHEIQYFLEEFPLRIVNHMDLFDGKIRWAHSGIYVFICPKTGRIYIGQSTRLSSRGYKQLYLRRWAKSLIIFDFEGFLCPETVKILEKRILRHAYERFAAAAWENERDLFAPSPDPFGKWGIYPELDALTRKVVDEIEECFLGSIPFEAPLVATHTLGCPS